MTLNIGSTRQVFWKLECPAMEQIASEVVRPCAKDITTVIPTFLIAANGVKLKDFEKGTGFKN